MDIPYQGGIVLRDQDGQKVGHMEARGTGSGVQLATVYGGFPVTSSLLVDLFDDETVEDVIAMLKMALERKQSLSAELDSAMRGGGPA